MSLAAGMPTEADGFGFQASLSTWAAAGPPGNKSGLAPGVTRKKTETETQQATKAQSAGERVPRKEYIIVEVPIVMYYPVFAGCMNFHNEAFANASQTNTAEPHCAIDGHSVDEKVQDVEQLRWDVAGDLARVSNEIKEMLELNVTRNEVMLMQEEKQSQTNAAVQKVSERADALFEVLREVLVRQNADIRVMVEELGAKVESLREHCLTAGKDDAKIMGNESAAVARSSAVDGTTQSEEHGMIKASSQDAENSFETLQCKSCWEWKGPDHYTKAQWQKGKAKRPWDAYCKLCSGHWSLKK